MTITRRLGIGYALVASACLLLLAWLWYHEFVEEPAEFAAQGHADLHKDTAAEFYTICFLALIPVLLGLGWWWTYRVLAPLRALTRAVEQYEPNHAHPPLPKGSRGDEVNALAERFSAMTKRLDSSFQQIREFTLSASHELKTPLTVMRAQLDTALRDNRFPPPGQGEWIESLRDEVRRLAGIVDSLTLLSMADAGLVTLEREPVSLNELVEEIFEDAVILAQPHRVHVALDECAGVSITGDRHRLRQLLLILADNAVKYCRPNGEIHIALGVSDGVAELRMTNDGGGFSPETERRLFGRFVRGENAVGKVEGSGLGLNIAKWIVGAHGGSIRLHSEQGKATTALVRLPLASSSPGSTRHD